MLLLYVPLVYCNFALLLNWSGFLVSDKIETEINTLAGKSAMNQSELERNNM